MNAVRRYLVTFWTPGPRWQGTERTLKVAAYDALDAAHQVRTANDRAHVSRVRPADVGRAQEVSRG